MRFIERVPDGMGGLKLQEAPMENRLIITGPTISYMPGMLTNDNHTTHIGPRLQKFIERTEEYNSELTAEGLLKARTKQTEFANGWFDITQKLMGLPAFPTHDAPSVRMLVGSYESEENCMENLEKSRANPDEYFSPEALKYTEFTFLNALGKDLKGEIKDNKWHPISGKPYNAKIVAKTLKQLYLQANSSGSSHLMESQNAFRHIAQQLGYSETDIELMMDSVTLLCTGNIANFIDSEKPGFKKIIIAGIGDKVAQALDAYDIQRLCDKGVIDPKLVTDIRDGNQPDRLIALPLGKNGLLLMVDIAKEHLHWREKVNSFDFKFIGNDKTRHHVTFYTLRGADFSIVPEICERVARNGMRGAISGKGIDNVEMLLEPTPPIWQSPRDINVGAGYLDEHYSGSSHFTTAKIQDALNTMKRAQPGNKELVYR